jgi:NarL family two-component system response regulator LiaR
MSQSPTIRVLLADDNDTLLSGLEVVLEMFDDLQLVGEASTGIEAVELCEQLQPDVVLMDLVMPDMDGVAATEIIRQKYPSIRVIALTSFDDEKLVQSAIKAGVSDYILKNVSIDQLATAIRDAYMGKSRLSL